MSPAQPSTSNYAAIGDCRSLALVSRLGSIDWFCTPQFSGPSLFAALLDWERGGRFSLGPAPEQLREAPTQRYEPASNVLRTRFACRSGVLDATDFMTLPESRGQHELQEIVRIVECVEGTVDLLGSFAPRPGYAGETMALQRRDELTWHGQAPSTSLAFRSSLPFGLEDGALWTSRRLHAGDRHVATLRLPSDFRGPTEGLLPDALQQRAATIDWWKAWCGRCSYRGPYADAVVRSALALKLLAHAPTGAVVAAGTTSLPEGEDGQRNWDYRYCWLRDSSLVLRAFVDLGFGDESDAYLRWLLHATRSTGARLQVVYDVHGGHRLPERVVPQLRGWRGIGPVRIGNAASGQVQHDVYGEVLITAWEHARRGGSLDADEKRLLAFFCDAACTLWREPDQGIWEVRLPPRHNTHSKLMCWSALDSSLHLHESHAVPIDVERVRRERDAIRTDIEAHGFDPALGSYVGYYGGKAADASLLMIPRLGYLPANHPHMVGTVREVFTQLRAGDLLYRYPPDSDYDGVPGPEHLFAICNFWAVDCLARQGRVAEARALYERLLTLRNPVGLYAEEFGVEDGRPIGNFPQAFSHVGLITAALTLAQAQAQG